MKWLLRLGLSLISMLILSTIFSACSSSGSGSGTTTTTFGVPKVEMKCNGETCIQ